MKLHAKTLWLSMSALVLTGLMSMPAMAQVVNSGPGATNSNSAVTMKATVPSIVYVKVSQAGSTLSKSIAASVVDSGVNTPGADFTITGDVLVNHPSANVGCTVSATTLELANGADKINVAMTGTIGGTNISTSSFSPTFTAKKAAINVSGDIDESMITAAKNPGDYTGVFTITASLL